MEKRLALLWHGPARWSSSLPASQASRVNRNQIKRMYKRWKLSLKSSEMCLVNMFIFSSFRTLHFVAFHSLFGSTTFPLECEAEVGRERGYTNLLRVADFFSCMLEIFWPCSRGPYNTFTHLPNRPTTGAVRKALSIFKMLSSFSSHFSVA